MNFFCMMVISLVAIVTFSFACRASAFTPGKKVSELTNRHNLSALNTGNEYRAVDEYHATNNPSPRGRQVCIFCHTPHSANVVGQAPLWNRAFSSETFQRYTSATLKIRNIPAAQYGAGAQPNGSSRLCLSCHDGVSRLGAVYSGTEIAMVKDVITGLASFKPDTGKMLTGHHPVSFVYLTGFSYSTQIGTTITGLPASYRFIPQSSAGRVKLSDTNRNGNGWMQCTTCHDPHQNQSDESACYNGSGAVVSCDATNTRKIAPFWTYHGTNTTATQDTGSVCKVCHALGAPGGFSPWP